MQHAVRNGRPTTTYFQERGDGFSVIARLDEAGGPVEFKNLIKPGQRLEPANDGGLVVLEGDNIVANIEEPWAVDANGRSLPTTYETDGSTIIQTIDTKGATFPVMADPTIKTGYHVVPVFYIQYTWSETWFVKNHLADGVTGAGLLCSQTGPAAPACFFIAGWYANDIRRTVDAAIAHKRCLKMRVPAPPGAFELAVAYDSYYVRCTR